MDQAWELFARFETTEKDKSVIIQRTPVDLGSRLPLVEASVIPFIPRTLTPLTNAVTTIVPTGASGEPTNHMADSKDHTAPTHGAIASCCNALSPPADRSLQFKSEAQQAEIARLTKSGKQYATRLRNANGEIRDLRNKLRDSESQREELQEKHDVAMKKINTLVGRNVVSAVTLTSSYTRNFFL